MPERVGAFTIWRDGPRIYLSFPAKLINMTLNIVQSAAGLLPVLGKFGATWIARREKYK
jgi:hypothetical protein